MSRETIILLGRVNLLSKHTAQQWNLKDTETNFWINLEDFDQRAIAYNLSSNRCNLCLTEKYL